MQEGAVSVDFERLLKKKELYQQGKEYIPQITVTSYEQAFEIEYTHNSTAIEGNTLTLIETKLVLEDGISVGGKQLREIYEQVNHQKAFRYVKDCIAKGLALDEKIVKGLYALLMSNIITGGVYRNVDGYISGAWHTPPAPNEMYRQVKNFYGDLERKGDVLNAIELATWTPCGVCKNPSVPVWQWPHLPAAHELSADGKGISASLNCQGKPSGLL